MVKFIIIWILVALGFGLLCGLVAFYRFALEENIARVPDFPRSTVRYDPPR